MSFKDDSNNKKGLKDLEEVIAKAIKKVGAKKENELCKYLPINTGGYMHHFTLKKMKYKDPKELLEIIQKHILSSSRPMAVPPKSRAPRGSRKKKGQLVFTKTQLERMLNIARLAGDKEIISVLSPQKSLATCKRDLILAIRHNRIEQDLWNTYTECVQALQNAQSETNV